MQQEGSYINGDRSLLHTTWKQTDKKRTGLRCDHWIFFSTLLVGDGIWGYSSLNIGEGEEILFRPPN